MTITLGELRPLVKAQLHITLAEMSDEAVDAHINSAVLFARAENLYIPTEDETLELADETYEYPLTGGELGDMVYVTDIIEETDESDVWTNYPISKQYWGIEQETTPYILFYEQMFHPIGGHGLRVKGLKPQPLLSEDSDILYLRESYIQWKAISFAHSILSGGGSDSRARWHSQQINYAEQQAEVVRQNMHEFRIPSWARRVRGR